MNFNPSDYDSHSKPTDELVTFTVPISGYYEVSSAMYHSVPIEGEYEEVANPNRRFWQFWKPKTILRQKYRNFITHSGREIRYLKKGEVVTSRKNAFFRIGS